MYIIKNALISIARNKGRSFLIGVIILVISAAVSVTLAINNSAENLIESYANRYETEATISVNRENMFKNFDPKNRDDSKTNMQEMFSSASTISEDDIKKYAESDYVKNYYYTLEIGVNSDTLEKAEMSTPTPENNNGDPKGMLPPNFDRGNKENFKNQSTGDFTLRGYSSLDSMTDFIEGNYTITSGEVYHDTILNTTNLLE